MDERDDTQAVEGPEQAAADDPTPEAPAASVEAQDTASMDASPGTLAAGQIVEGLIVHIDEQGALVDVGTKSEGHISAAEMAGGTTDDGKALEVGDRVAVYVVRPEDDEGNPVLSKKKADYERVWTRL